MNKSKIYFWAPRVIAILYILFLSLFSLDVFEMNLGFWGTILGLLVHNIPSFILILILVIAWNKEIVGAITFILAGLFYVGIIITNIITQTPRPWYMLGWIITITGPALLVGGLFLKNWLEKKRPV